MERVNVEVVPPELPPAVEGKGRFEERSIAGANTASDSALLDALKPQGSIELDALIGGVTDVLYSALSLPAKRELLLDWLRFVGGCG